MNLFIDISYRKIIPIFCFLALYHQAYAQRKNIVFESTFDSANSISKWKEQSLYNPWSGTIVHDNIRAGASALKVELRRSSDTLNGPRAELGLSPYQTLKESWYGFSDFFPSNYSVDPASEIVNQWQAMPDLQFGETWRSPPLALEIKNDRFKIAIRWCSEAVNTSATTYSAYLDMGPVGHNKWNDWVFHIKWGYNSGNLQVWKNDTLVLERVNKPIGYNDVYYPYFKTGIYKWEWHMPNSLSTSTNRSYYIDEVRVGNASATYNDVSPKPSGALPVKLNTLNVSKNKDGSFTASFIASSTTQSKEFILYISDDEGKTFYPTYVESPIKLEKEKSYTLKFNPKK